jgi:integrase
MTVGEWHDRWQAGRLAAAPTRARDASVWRVHVAPRWAKVRLDAVGREAVRSWVRELSDAGAGPPTVRIAVGLLSSLLAEAVRAERIEANPCAGVTLPRLAPRAPFFWTYDEAAAILSQLSGADRTMIDLALHTGLRVGELTGLRSTSVDLSAGLIHVTGVQTRAGWRAWPKTSRSARAVPIPDHLLDELKPLIVGRRGLLFTAPRGGGWDDRHLATRLLEPAIRVAGVRRGTPRDLRHTAASHLAMAGVDLYRIQHLLGHESITTTMRYSHLAPSAHDAVRAAWRDLGGHALVTAPAAGTPESPYGGADLR